MHEYGWNSWVRALSPTEVREIAEDLVKLQSAFRDDELTRSDSEYVVHFLNRAVEFVTGVAASNRGFAYLIG